MLADLLNTVVTWADDASTFVPHDRPDVVAGAVLGVARRPTVNGPAAVE